MKRVLIFLALIASGACLPATPTLLPAQTAAALTMAAMPKTDTPTNAPSETPAPPSMDTPTPTSLEVDSNIPGAYCLPKNTERVRVLVTRVLDGESIEVAMGNQAFVVRYIGLDAPGIVPQVEWQGPQAIAANGDLVSGKFVILVRDVSDTDSSGRLLRYVLVDNIFVNYELIRQGYARTQTQAPDLACEAAFRGAELEAQAALKGIWSAQPTSTPTITLTPTITATATRTLVPVCNCTGPRLTCNDFDSQAEAQACFEYCVEMGYGDIFGIDKNGNGLACEGLP